MVPVNFVSRLVSRPQLLHRLSRNLNTTGELFGGCGCRQTKEDCPPKKCETKVTKPRRKCKPSMESHQSGRVDGKLPEFCSKTALAEFSLKMQELQKNWALIASEMEKDCAARGYKKDKDQHPKSQCAVKPPKKDDDEKSSTMIFVVLAALALAAALGYYLYLESQKSKDKDAKEDDDPEKKKDDDPDKKKDDDPDKKKDDKSKDKK